MNPDQPSRAEIEVKLTALLLGELPEEEARLLRWTVAQDPELQQLHDQLQRTIGLVREVAANPEGSGDTAPLKLSADRRQKLLAHFQTPRRHPLFWLKPLPMPSLINVLVVVAFVAIFAAMLLPALSKAKSRSARATQVTYLSGKAEPEPANEALPVPQSKEVSPPAATVMVEPIESPLSVATGGVETNSALLSNYWAATSTVNGYYDDQRSPQPATSAVFGSKREVVTVASAPVLAPPPAPPAAGGGGVYSQNIVGFANVNTGNVTAGTVSPTVESSAPVPVAAVDRDGEGDLKNKDARNENVPAKTINPATAALVPPVSGQNRLDTQTRAESVEKRWVLPTDHNTVHTKTPMVTTGGADLAFGGTAMTLTNGLAGELTANFDQPKSVELGIPNQPASVSGGEYAFNDKQAAEHESYRLPALKDSAHFGIVSGVSATDVRRNRQTQLRTTEAVANNTEGDKPISMPKVSAPVPQPEVLTRENAFSTFSLNVSDVAFKLAAASLEKGQLPDVATVRSEEFINAFDYHDPEALAGQPMAFAAERARYPFAVNRDLLRFSIKTAAAGRPANQPLNLVLLLDNSGSMERADRVAIIQAALKVLATQLHPQDTLSVVTFARTAHLWADGVRGDQAGETLDKAGRLTPQGGTNLEEALRLAYETALRHYQSGGLNRVVLFTDGAANLGNVDAMALREKVEAARRQGVALDCFGIGWEGYNDDLLEQLSSHGDGRYAFLNAPEEVAKEFAAKLAGGLQVAASDVKVQVEFNPGRVISWRQFGYAKHQLTKEQFRDNTVDAAEIGAREAGNALYTVETKPDGAGPIATVRVRYKVPGTTDYQERSWEVPYTGSALSLEQSGAAMRLAGTAGAFAEWLAQSPHAQQVSPAELLKIIRGVPQIYSADERPKQLEWMIGEAQRFVGK